MAPKLPPAKIIDLRTVLDAEPEVTAAGAIVWARVELFYAPAEAAPSVTIRIPIPWSPGDTDDQRRDLALRFARQLIDHACIAMAPPAAETGAEEPVILEGLAQELGLSSPTTTPLRRRRK